MLKYIFQKPRGNGKKKIDLFISNLWFLGNLYVPGATGEVKHGVVSR
jgi:hypothetical protein